MKRVDYNRVCPGCNERYHVADRTPRNVIEIERCARCAMLALTHDGRRKVRKRRKMEDGSVFETIECAY